MHSPRVGFVFIELCLYLEMLRSLLLVRQKYSLPRLAPATFRAPRARLQRLPFPIKYPSVHLCIRHSVSPSRLRSFPQTYSKTSYCLS